jgi:DNA-binding beta-propeller fold protein YncE
MAAGLAVTANGKRLVAANFENDSASVIDLEKQLVMAEIDLRPGKINPAEQGVLGGEYPFWVVIKSNAKAYISGQRDEGVVVLDLTSDLPTVRQRIAVGHQPNKMVLNWA